jgi:hypothetical protein
MKRATREAAGDAPLNTTSVVVHPAAKTCLGGAGCANGSAGCRAKKSTVGAEGIRSRAYELWEQAGRPAGDGTEFWFAAERETRAMY